MKTIISKSFRLAKLRKAYPHFSESELNRMVVGLPTFHDIRRCRCVSLNDINAYMDLVFPVMENGIRRNMVDVLSDNCTAREIRESIEKNLGSLDGGINAPGNLSDKELLALLPSRYATSSLATDYIQFAREYITEHQKLDAEKRARESQNISES